MTLDEINSMWRYRLKSDDLPERLIKRARRKRDQKLENKNDEKNSKELILEDLKH